MDRGSKSSGSSNSSTSSPASVKKAGLEKDGESKKNANTKETNKLVKQSSSKSLSSPYSQNPKDLSSKPRPLVKSKSMPQATLQKSLPASSSQKSTTSSPSPSSKSSNKSGVKSKGNSSGGSSGSGGGGGGNCKTGSGVVNKDKNKQNNDLSNKKDSKGGKSKSPEDKTEPVAAPPKPTKEKGNRLLETVRKHCLGKGDRGIYDLGVLFRHLDTDYNKRIVYEEMRDKLDDYGLNMSEDNVKCLFHHMDEDRSGGIDFLELMTSLRPPMAQSRVKVINEAYDVLDRNGDGMVDHEEIKGLTKESYVN